MRLKTCLLVLWLLATVALVWICVAFVLAGDAGRQQAREQAAEWRVYCAFCNGFWEGAVTATNALAFDANTGKWTLKMAKMHMSLSKGRYGYRPQKDWLEAQVASQLRLSAAMYQPIVAETNAITFDTKTGEWTLRMTNLLQCLWMLVPPSANRAVIYDTNTRTWSLETWKPLGWNQANGQSAWMWTQSGNGKDLLDVMPSCNYFYYFGHGTADSFGMGHWSLFLPNSASNIRYNDITTFLVNQTLHNWPTASFPTNSHPYRLVFIDGCQSAGGGLPAAFGIPTGQFSTNYFIGAGVPCRAFVGYSKPFSIIITQIPDYYDMLQSFWNNWLQDRSVHEMVTNCQSAAKFSLFAMPSSAVIDGCPALFQDGP